MDTWKIRIQTRGKKSDFNPDSDEVAEATLTFLKAGGRISREAYVERAATSRSFSFFDNDMDFSMEGI